MTYSTETLDLISEATLNGQTPISFYQTPIEGSLQVSKVPYDVSSFSNTLQGCAETCLRQQACGAFEYRAMNMTVLCLLTVSSGTESVDLNTGFMLYVKDSVKVSYFYRLMQLHCFYETLYKIVRWFIEKINIIISSTNTKVHFWWEMQRMCMRCEIQVRAMLLLIRLEYVSFKPRTIAPDYYTYLCVEWYPDHCACFWGCIIVMWCVREWRMCIHCVRVSLWIRWLR